jgi:Flp pilus assembly protein TadG
MLARLVHAAHERAVRLRRDCSGATAVVFAVTLSATLGFTALGTEVSLWYAKKRDMQGVADSAAYSGAVTLISGGDAASQAKAIAAEYGYADQVNGVAVTVNHPPASGAYQGNNAAVEVIIQQPQQRLLSTLYLGADPALRSRAVAIAGAGDACVLALNAGASAATFGNGTTNVDLVGCGLVVNSTSPSALTLTGQAQITAQSAAIAGGYSTSGGAELNTEESVVTGAPPLQDPFQNTQIPSYSGCDQTSYQANAGANVTLNPGVYCNGFSVQGGATVTLNPGVYIIDRGTFSVAGNATVTGNGVTIVLTSSTASNYATVSISGGAVVNLSAPTSGSTAGLAFFQDKNAPTGVNNSFTGGSTQNITGAIYLPKQEVGFAGGSQGSQGCTLLIADQIDFKGNANLATNCAGTAVPKVMQPPRLVE